MKKIKLLFSLLLLSASLLSQTPVNRAILNSLWKNRVVPPLTDVSTTFASLYNIVDDGIPTINLIPTTVKTANYTLTANQFVPVDISSGSFTLTLPTAPTDGYREGIKVIAISGTNSVIVKAGGSDVFNKAAGSTTLALTLLNQAVTLQYKASSAIWYVLSDDLPLSQLDLRYPLTSSSYTNPSWIASLPWSKITTTPTTLSGYGITDGVLNTTSLTINGTAFDLSANRSWSVGDALVANPLSQFASTTSSQLAGVLSDETGTGAAVFQTSPTLGGVITTNSTALTSTISGTSWFDGGLSGNSGFNFYSDDPSNASFGFNFHNSSNSLKLYQDHGANNWLVVNSGANFVVSVDGGGSQAFEIDKTAMSFAVGTSTVGNATTYLWSAANNTGQTASTEEVYFKYASKSIQYATGALARHRNFYVSQPSIKFVGASTVTDAANLYVESAPIASTNATITNSSALLISGMSGTASVGAGVTNAYGIKVHPPTGATNNYAAALMGLVGVNTTAPTHTLEVTGNFSVSSTGGFGGALTVGGGIVGVTTTVAATAGNVGETLSTYITSGSAVTFTTATATNVATLSLTAGDWLVSGQVIFNETTSTVTDRQAGINSTSATIPSDGSEAFCGVQSTVTSEKNSIGLPAKEMKFGSTTTIYLVGKPTFSAGTCTGYGFISATRIR